MTSPAQRWDDIYENTTEPGQPADFVTAAADLLPESGTAVDLAGGPGATALWLAERGLHTTLLEVSRRALDVAIETAARRGVAIEAVQHDLEADVQLRRTWDLAVVSNFLHRPLLGALRDLLNPGGLALVRIATVTNLERHDRPSARFLVEEDELSALCPGLEVIDFVQRWFDDRHEARLIARRP